MQRFENDLVVALVDLDSEFQENELAYLALTSKIEHPFRDRLAFRLHRRRQDSECLVAREWHRVDLAILDPAGKPLCLVELKAMYSFDALRDALPFIAATQADEVKASLRADACTSVYSLLLVTHVDGQISENHKRLVKYSGGISRALTAHQSSTEVRRQAREMIGLHMSDRALIASGQVNGGQAFGLEVTIFYWLVRSSASSSSRG